MSESTDTLSGEVIHKFLILNRYLRWYARQMSAQGIRPRELSVLRFLLEVGPATIGQIQAYLYRSASTTSTLVSSLEEAGYVTRTRSREDNRVVIVDLTPIGRELAQNTAPGGIVLLRRRLKTLPAARLRLLDEALAELMQLMEVEEVE